MSERLPKAHTALDALLMAACAAALFIMLRAGAVFILGDRETRGALACALAAAAALAVVPGLAALCRGGGSRVWAAALCLLALLPRAAFVFDAQSVPASDFALLYSAAEAFAAGDSGAFRTEYFALWGYQIPFALAVSAVLALGGSALTLGLINAALGAAVTLEIYVLARRFASNGAAFAAAALYALCPAAILLTPTATNQFLALALFLLAVILYLRGTARMSAAAGAALALGNLARGEGAVIFCALLAVFVLELIAARSRRRAVLFGFAALVFAYALTTLAVRGAVALAGIAPDGTGSAFPEWKLVLGLDASSLGRYDGSLEYLLSLPEAERSAEAGRLIREELANPHLAAFLWEKTERFWGGYEESWLGVTNDWIYPLRYADRVAFMAASALALAGCMGRSRDGAETAARAAVFAAFAVYIIIEVQPRYRALVWPFLLLCAAAGLDRLLRLYGRIYGHLGRKRV